jgi:paraquat-inducible protein B
MPLMAVEIAERPPAAQEPPPVEIRRRRLPSAIWAIPIVAALIGAYLVWVDYTQRGPTITIVFDDATGLVAGKTIVKYKDVEVGKVATVSLNQDLSKINVTAEMHREFAPFLTEGAQFWLVSAQISASGVSGLETLLSGAYVGIDPGPTGGQEKREFAALSEPPLIRSDVPGTEYVLHADKLGGVGRGSIVTFQGFLAGQILGAELSDDRKSTVFRAFVKAPYDELVTRTSRFWNASGFSVAVSSSGMQVDIDSLQTIVAGGVAFDSGAGGDRAAAGTAFPLFDRGLDLHDACRDDRRVRRFRARP